MESTHLQPVIPVVDFRSTKSKLEVGRNLLDAFKSVGFAYVKHPGPHRQNVGQTFEMSRKFFALPLDIKNKVAHPPDGSHHCGYSGIGREKVSQKVFDAEAISEIRKVPDHKESFDFGSENGIQNLWPADTDLPGFRDVMTRFYESMRHIELDVFAALALAMNLPEEALSVHHTGNDNQVRLLHYPTVDEGLLAEQKVERLGAHTDYGTLSFLMQDDAGGLEVEDPYKRGTFIPVPPIVDTVVVNVADLLERWTNDRLKSTMHRVRAPPAAEVDRSGNVCRVVPERYSIVYFVGPKAETIIDCIPGFEEAGPKYEAITASDYINQRLDATY